MFVLSFQSCTMWILIIALSYYVLPNVCARSLRKNPDLFTFNTAVNSNITAKIQDEAVIVSLIRTAYTDEDLTKEHILFGFDIFHFVPQNFRVSVNYPNKKILFNITSTINTYSIPFDLKKKEKIKSLFLRMNDEDDTVFAVVNCDGSTSVVTPINLIKFFRTTSVNKFKIMFNKRYELNVYTEDDDMEDKIKKQCNVKEVLLEGKQQSDLELDRISTKLVKFTPHLYSFLYNHKNKSDVALEIFLKAFLSKDVIHKSANSYRLVHLIQSIATTFLEIFQPEVQVLLSKIFWTQGKEHHYIRKWRPNYYNDVSIKNELINIMFSDSPKTFLDSMRSLSKIGQKFREVFANPKISINEVMKNDSHLKDLLLDIVFQKPLDKDQMNFLNPNHIIKRMFANYYLRDLNVNSEILNNIHKLIILHADQQDYLTIGKFFRYVFFKDSGFLHANIFLEPDLVIGMRVVYVLASGHVAEKRDIYWTVRSLITKKDVELPKALEYPESIITNTLRKCYENSEMSRYIFMQTLENLFIYNNPRIGSFLDSNQGAFIYNLYRDLILNDIQKENSVLKTVLMESSHRIQGMLGLMIQSVVANVDNIKKLRQIATVFVNDTLSFAKIEASDIIQSEEDYVKIFKKLIGRSSNDTDEQKKINFKIILLKHKFENQEFHPDTIEKALSHVHLQLNVRMKNLLNEVYMKYGNNADTLVRKIDEILDNRYKAEKEFEDIVAQDLKEGVTFDNSPITNETISLYLTREGEEDPSITKERIRKMKELHLLEDWYNEQAKYHQNLIRKLPHLNAPKEQFEEESDELKHEKKHKLANSKKRRKHGNKNVEKTKSQSKVDDSSPLRQSSQRGEKNHVNQKNEPYSVNLNAKRTANMKFDRASNFEADNRMIEKKYTVKPEGTDKVKKQKSKKKTTKPNSRAESKISIKKYDEKKNVSRSEGAASNKHLANRNDGDRRVKTSEVSSNRDTTKAEDKGTLRKKTNSVDNFVEGESKNKNKTHSRNINRYTKDSRKHLKKSSPDKDDKKLTEIINKTSSRNETKVLKDDDEAFLFENLLKKDFRVTNETEKSRKDVKISLAGENETDLKTPKVPSNKTREKSTDSKSKTQINNSGKNDDTFIVNTPHPNPHLKKVSKIHKKTVRIETKIKSFVVKNVKDVKKHNTTRKKTYNVHATISKLVSSSKTIRPTSNRSASEMKISVERDNKDASFMAGGRNRSEIPEFNSVKATGAVENMNSTKNKTGSSDKKTMISKADMSEIPPKNSGKNQSNGGYNRKMYEKGKESLVKKLSITKVSLTTANKTDSKNNETLLQKNEMKNAKKKTINKTEESEPQNLTTSKKPLGVEKISNPEKIKIGGIGQGNDTTKFQDKNHKINELSKLNNNRSLGEEEPSEVKENRKNENISKIIGKNHMTEGSRAFHPTNKGKGSVSIQDKVSEKITKLAVKKQEKLNKIGDTKETEQEKGKVKINGTGKETETNLVSKKTKMPKTSNGSSEIKLEKKKSLFDAQVDTLVEPTKKKTNSSNIANKGDNKAASQLKPSLDKDLTLGEKNNENENAPSSKVSFRSIQDDDCCSL